jgi:signal transduction histidine kinase
MLSFENRYVRKDGSSRVLEWTVTPVVEESVMYAVAHDVTERRRAEIELERIAGEQAALRRVATLVADGVGPEEVFAAVATEVGQLLEVDVAGLIRYDPQDVITIVGVWTSPDATGPTLVGSRLPLGGRNVTTLVWRTGSSARIDYADVSGPIGEVAAREWRLRSSVGVPVTVEGRLWGVMIVGLTRDELLASDAEVRLAGFTELVGTALANAEARAQLIASRARIVAAADAARQRIERDLHDGAQQRLVCLALELRAARVAVPPEAGELAALLGDLADEATGAQDELRELARGIHPGILADGGLTPALAAAAGRSVVPVVLDVRVDRQLAKQTEIAAYYLVSEALTNAAKHAQASVVHVEVDTAEGALGNGVLRIAVRDDGAGGAEFTGGTGLVGLKDRVEALGGTIEIESARGKGTALRATLPITASSSNPSRVIPADELAA